MSQTNLANLVESMSGDSTPRSAARSMGILHVLAPAPYGGLERVVCALARGQAQRGHRASVAAVLSTGATDSLPFLEAVGDTGARLEIIRVGARAYGRERAELRSLFARLSPDVVHTHGYRPDVLDAGLARRLGIPVVTTVHGFTGGGWKNRVYEWLQCRAFRRFDAVVAVSSAMVERLVRAGVPRARVHVLRNAWASGGALLERAAARRELGLGAADWVVGYAGRLSSEKGPDVLIDALGLLRDLPMRVSILGDGVEGERLRQRAAATGVGASVHWHGAVPSAGRLFRAFDVFVLPSRTEGTPIALFEAMAAGVPVVATRVGGVPEVVGQGAALLVPPEAPQALAAALRACHTDPQAAVQRATAARVLLDRDYTLAPWLEAYETVYTSVQGRSPRGGAR